MFIINKSFFFNFYIHEHLYIIMHVYKCVSVSHILDVYICMYNNAICQYVTLIYNCIINALFCIIVPCRYHREL